MPRKTDPAKPGRNAIEKEIARLRGLTLIDLRARWRTVLRRAAPPHLSRQLLFRTLAYRLQAERLGDLDAECRKTLERLDTRTAVGIAQLVSGLKQSDAALQPGTLLTREWNGHLHRVMVLPAGFGWNGKTYKSLSQVASAIAGSRWNGPRFFGLRDKPSAGARP
jgi:hypothetical protein